MNAINDVEFNGCYVITTSKKHGIAPTLLHYWINGLIHAKRKGPLTMITAEREQEGFFGCKEMVGMGHGMELIHLKSTISETIQGMPNLFIDRFLRKSWWLGFKKRHPELVL